ncbi:MAG: alanine--tRNA ligase [Oscillospiraceae bacterium]|nr:alanine--tRNA ligase [Oscillospiraceae bacterium]
MKKYGLNELREMFLAFFEEKGHLRLPSFSLIPQNDPSLLLISSGMAPMKTWFTGEQEPPRKRVCTCQKCVRTVDIDEVGKTSRHASYFEMLGNFSFGDYFKSESLAWSWEFLTEKVGLNPELLYPSVFIEDDEAYDIWVNEIGIKPERMTKLGREDNFWDHGSGPCGPNSEIYFDRGVESGCGKPGCAPGCDCDRYIEVWNNVFTQFNNDGAGNYSELSQKNIDTGMGLERLACVCQGVSNLFEVDTIVSIVDKVSEISGVTYGADDKADVSVRIITDHIRSATMMICDGVLPSNEGRGYVLRRLLRRAVRCGKLLGIDTDFLCDVCDVVIDLNKDHYTELVEKADFIKRVLQNEEESFGKTINAGTAMLNELIVKLKTEGLTVLSGEDAFKLYDTYGFPLDLTVDMLSESGLAVDTDGFNEYMEEQRLRARKAREALGDLAWAGIDLGLEDTTPTEFSGYEKMNDSGTVLAIVNQGEVSSSIRKGDEGIIVLDKTPFYAEKGGQSADFGVLSCNEAVFEVTNVGESKGNKYLHYGVMREGELSVDNFVTAAVDAPHRLAIMRAHTATHIMHEALKSILGEHVNQAGSLVEPDKLRFDFTHFSALTKDELNEIEKYVNDAVLSGYFVTADEMSLDDAKKLGATALFGEKYGNIVRVVKMGDSIELCGGTHLDNTAKTGAFSILSEFSVASGVRRIEAITGYATLALLNTSRTQLSQLSGILKANTPDEIAGKLELNMATLRELRAKLDSAISKESGSEAKRILTGARDIGGLKIITTIIDDANVDVDKLRQIEDTLRDLELGVVAVLAAVKDDKITIMAACGKIAIEKGIKAGELIREVTKLCGGSGGGKPEFAMGGGKDASKLKETFDAVDKFVINKLNLAEKP